MVGRGDLLRVEWSLSLRNKKGLLCGGQPFLLSKEKINAYLQGCSRAFRDLCIAGGGD